MNRLYSSLFVNSKRFPDVHQVLKPRYNKEFFKRLTKNIDQLDALVKLRCSTNTLMSRTDLDVVKNESPNYVKLITRLNALRRDKKGDHEISRVQEQLECIQDRIMPTVVDIPNRFNKDTPEQNTIIDEVKSDFLTQQKLTKLLSHIKLSYINNCYSKSVVGPNSHYYFGIGAKLQLGLSDYFMTELERHNFIPISGHFLSKSALIEATNSKEVKDYTTDPCRVLTNNREHTTMHLTEASREALVGFLCTLGHIVSDEPVRFICNGAGYRQGNDWFDADSNKISQFETLHGLVWNSSIEYYSWREYNKVIDIVWNIYVNLGLPARQIKCSLNSLHSNEYAARRIEMWLPSRQQWIQAARVSHYLDYITIRSGMKRGHLIDFSAYDGQVLVSAIIENRQNSLGRFMIPSVIYEHMKNNLTEQETREYFELTSPGSSSSTNNNITDHFESSCDIAKKLNINHIVVSQQDKLNKSMTNFEQRRYLVKKMPLLGHSKRAWKNNYLEKTNWITFFGMCHVAVFIDWDHVYHNWLPIWFQRFSYDYLFRPIRRILWRLTYVDVEPPQDVPFDDLDLSRYLLNLYERKKLDYKLDRELRGPDI